jgi:regulator of sigma E protease
MFSGKDFTPAVIQEVQKDSPAYVAGIKKNDLILSINKNEVHSILDVSTYINASTSEIINIKIDRNNQEIFLVVKPKKF